MITRVVTRTAFRYPSVDEEDLRYLPRGLEPKRDPGTDGVSWLCCPARLDIAVRHIRGFEQGVIGLRKGRCLDILNGDYAFAACSRLIQASLRSTPQDILGDALLYDLTAKAPEVALCIGNDRFVRPEFDNLRDLRRYPFWSFGEQRGYSRATGVEVEFALSFDTMSASCQRPPIRSDLSWISSTLRREA